MLVNVLEAEKKAIADDKARAEEATAAGRQGSGHTLETIVEDETGHCVRRRGRVDARRCWCSGLRRAPLPLPDACSIECHTKRTKGRKTLFTS
jgi:hypothetical protein